LGFFIARKNGLELAPEVSLIITVAVTTVVWVATTLLAPATDEETLQKFYTLVRPSGPGWRHVAERTGVRASEDSMSQAMLGWVLGCTFVYSALFGAGSFIYGRMPQFWMWLVVCVASGFGMARVLRGFWSTSDVPPNTPNLPPSPTSPTARPSSTTAA
jgi:hypothetical protein